MPCHFSGIFYVSQFQDNKLLCSFKDENGDIHPIDVIYYFPATVDRPFPQAYESIQPGHVYFIAGSLSFQNKDLIVYSSEIILTLTSSEMNATFVYRQNVYTDVHVSDTDLPKTLPNMFLTVITTVRVTQPITVLSALKDDFPSWKYFTGEFEKYIAGNNRVRCLFLNISFF